MLKPDLDIFAIEVTSEAMSHDVQNFLFTKGYRWYSAGRKINNAVPPYPYYIVVDNRDMDITHTSDCSYVTFTLQELDYFTAEPVELFVGKTWSVLSVNGEEQVILASYLPAFKTRWKLEQKFKQDLLDSVNSNGEDFAHKEWEIAKAMINRGWSKIC